VSQAIQVKHTYLIPML